METPQPTAEEMLARVLHRDGLMLVIDKPPGIAVHRGPKGGPNLEASFDALRFGLPRPPVLAHRLDRDTSGCLVLGRHRKATATLGLLFKHGRIAKTYWAVVEGGPADDDGTIDIPLGRLNAERGWWQKPDPDGAPASTRWRVMGRSSVAKQPLAQSAPSPLVDWGGGLPQDNAVRPTPLPNASHSTSPTRGEVTKELTWLALEPLTGRTHQLRVHCAAMGWPIVGDNIYGTQASLRRLRNEPYVPRFGEPSLHLHARAITIPLSKTKPPVHVEAPVPQHMQARLTACGWQGDASGDEAHPVMAGDDQRHD